MHRMWLVLLAAGCGGTFDRLSAAVPGASRGGGLVAPGAGELRRMGRLVKSSKPGGTAVSPIAVSLATGGSFVPPATASVGLLLPAADEADDEAPDEIVPLLRPSPPVQPVPGPHDRAPGARYKIGFRGGYLSSGGAERDWKEMPIYGLYVRRAPRRSGRAALEVGADYVSAETEDEARSSSLVFLHADLLLGLSGAADAKGASLYVFAGGQGILEDSTDNVTGVSASGRGGGVETGLGYGARNGGWDIRATYSLFLASENAENSIAVSMGFAF